MINPIQTKTTRKFNAVTHLVVFLLESMLSLIHYHNNIPENVVFFDTKILDSSDKGPTPSTFSTQLKKTRVPRLYL